LSERFFSIQKFRVDPSVRNRNVEAWATFTEWQPSYLIGYGLSTESRYINIITFKTMRVRWNHNAMPWMLFHFGIIGSCILLTSFIAYIIQALLLFFRLKKEDWIPHGPRFMLRAISAGVFAVLATLLIVFWTGNPYTDRGSFLGLAFLYGFVDLITIKLDARSLEVISE
jgi:hypothetical protein